MNIINPNQIFCKKLEIKADSAVDSAPAVGLVCGITISEIYVLPSCKNFCPVDTDSGLNVRVEDVDIFGEKLPVKFAS